MMDLLRLAELFSNSAKRCQTTSELFSLTEAAARELGFPKLAMVHGLWFQCPGQQLIKLDNFGEWRELFIERHYYRDDPALLASQRTNAAFAWAAMRRLIHFTDRQEKIIEEAARYGLRNGYTLPIGVIGEPHGCCSFVTGRSKLPSQACCRVASLVGAEAFREARRLQGFPQNTACLPRLSRRKIECLRYLACGKTAGETATILGLSERTIRSYHAMLHRDFDVVSGPQLVAAALRLGFIGYDVVAPALR